LSAYQRFLKKEGLEIIPTPYCSPEEYTTLEEDLRKISDFFEMRKPILLVEKKENNTIASAVQALNRIIFYYSPITFKYRKVILIHECLHLLGINHRRSFRSGHDTLSPEIEKQIFERGPEVIKIRRGSAYDNFLNKVI